MNHAVIKYPNEYTISVQRDLGDETGPLFDGEELMTTDELETWKQLEPQVAKRNEIIEASKAKEIATKAAERQAKIDEMVAATGLPASACEYLLKSQGLIV